MSRFRRKRGFVSAQGEHGSDRPRMTKAITEDGARCGQAETRAHRVRRKRLAFRNPARTMCANAISEGHEIKSGEATLALEFTKTALHAPVNDVPEKTSIVLHAPLGPTAVRRFLPE